MREKKDIFDKIMHLPGLRVFEEVYIKHKEVLLYLFFGFLTFVVSIGSFAYCNKAMHMNELLANIISWILAVLFAYVTNKIWVFDGKTNGVVDFIRQIVAFFGGRVFTLIVEELILFVFITKLGMGSIVIKVIAQVVVIVLNYVISKLIVFKGNKR